VLPGRQDAGQDRHQFLIFPPFARTTLLTMRRVLWCISFVLVLAASLIADSNLRITDVGLHGYYGTPSAVRLIVRNPSSQPQLIHLQVAAGNENEDTSRCAAAIPSS
jgi:P pilus assembly chaperone PapD